MEAKPNYQLVGVSIVVMAILLCSVLIWLAGGANEYSKTYRINFHDHSLSGLQKDSYVTMNGVTVGSVSDYRIAPDDLQEVQVTIQLTDDIPVKTSTTAQIARNLLTGIARVELNGGRQSDPDLTAPDDSIPVIPEGNSAIDQITDSIPDMLADVSEVTASLKKLASKENAESLSRTIANLEASTAWFREKQNALDNLIGSFQTVGENADSISESIGKIASDSGKQFRKIGTDAERALEEIALAAETVQKEIEKVAGAIAATSALVSQEVVVIGNSIDSAADSVSAASEGFEEPGKIISGPSKEALGPGERIDE